MNGSDFFRTPMGHRFYEHTMPELVRQLTRLNDLLESMLVVWAKHDAKKEER